MPTKRFSHRKFRELCGDKSRPDLAFSIRHKTGVKVSMESIRHYQRGDCNPNSEKLAAIAEYFGTSIDYLFEIKER